MATIPQRLHAWLSDNPDEAVLRSIFRGTVTVTVAVLAADLAGQNGWITWPDPMTSPAEIRQTSPSLDLPSIAPSILAPLLPGGDRRATPLLQPEGVLAKPMTFELVGGGKLMATGTITPGISENFAAEIGKRGDYIKTVVLNSPGGSVADAMAMGRLIRESKFATEVGAGKYCASSCPLVFAGGVERRSGDKAVIGVHQVAALSSPAAIVVRDEMGVAQNISARCQRYQPAGLGPCNGNAARQIVRVQAGRTEITQFGDDSAGFAARSGAVDASDDKKVIDFAWPAVCQGDRRNHPPLPALSAVTGGVPCRRLSE
jgi:hypothetical protein